MGDWRPINHVTIGEPVRLHSRTVRLWQCCKCEQYIYQREVGVGHRDYVYLNYLMESMGEYDERLEVDEADDAREVERAKQEWLSMGRDWKTGKKMDKPD